MTKSSVFRAELFCIPMAPIFVSRPAADVEQSLGGQDGIARERANAGLLIYLNLYRVNRLNTIAQL